MKGFKKTKKAIGMKFIILLMILVYGNVYGQWKWQKSIGGLNSEVPIEIVKAKDGFIIAGNSTSNVSFDKSENSKNNSQDFWIIKVDSNGNRIWDKTIGSNSEDVLSTMIITSDNGFILGGYSTGNIGGDKTETNYGKRDFWIVKLDSLRNKVWDKTFGGSDDDEDCKIIEFNNGYIVAGTSRSDSSGNKLTRLNGVYDVWIIKIDRNGNKIWEKTLGGSGYDKLDDLIQLNNNEIIIGASSSSSISNDKSTNTISNNGFFDFWVIKIDSNGNKIWDKVYGSSGGEAISDVELFNNKILLVGTTYNSRGGFDITETHRGDTTFDDIWIQAIDFNGSKLWNKIIGGNLSETEPKISIDKNYIYISCLSTSNNSFDKSEPNRSFSPYNDFWILKLDSLGKIYWDKTIGTSNGENYVCKPIILNSILIVGVGSGGADIDKVVNSNGGADFWLINLYNPIKKIKGSVFPDFNSNCLYNRPSEFTFPNVLIHNKTENTYAMTNDSFYTMYLFDRNTAVLKIINLDSNLYIACGKDSIVVDMTGKTDTSGIDFPIRSNKTGHCINITSFSSGSLRPGRWGNYQLNYQNNAFDTAYNAYIEIEVDTSAIDSIKSPYSFTLTGTILRFNLGHLRPFGFSSVSYSIKLKTTVIIGSSHCHRAKVFPICNIYPTKVYDSSEIQPMMRCLQNDTVEFTLKNIGLRDQKDWGHSIIYVDELILKKDSFKLTVGNSRIFKYKLDTNKVFTAEVFNSNFHPVTPILIRHNDLCANKRPIIPANPALNFSRHDEAKEYEEACTIVRGSYDPNIKSVQPVGMFAEHYTSTGTELKYRIDFQNTGTDTAFRVVLVDTLSSFLDIASFVPGVSSHPYSVEFGGRAVKFIFDPIRLIDSGTNEPASHGYVHFKIKHITGISPKTKIENKADIYFDYNAPIRTNAVFNTIFDTIQIYVPKGENAITENHKTTILVFPNPTTDKFFIQMSEPVKYLSLEIYDMQGRLIKSVPSSNNQTIEVSAQGMTQGIYHIRCMSGEKLVVVKKVMVE